MANTSSIADFSSNSRGITLAATLLDEGTFHEVGGAQVDTMPHRYPMDRQQRLEVILQARDRGGELSAIPLDDPIRLSPSGIEGGSVLDGTNLSHHLRRRIVSQLDPNVRKGDEPSSGSGSKNQTRLRWC